MQNLLFIYLNKEKHENNRSLLQSLTAKLKEKLKSILQLQIKALCLSQTEETFHIPELQVWEVFQNFSPGKSEDGET